MKDCGVFSIFYKNYNYGGQLQAYSMCRVIEKNGNTVEQICYVRGKSFLRHKIIVVLKKSWKEKKDLMRRYINRFLVKIGFRADYARNILSKFDSFMNIVPHSRVFTSDTIVESVDGYKLFVSGSDQVWNPDTCSDEWFLNFLPDGHPRIAYSASIGKEYFTNEEKERLEPLIKQYNYIGVREDKAKQLIQSFVDADVDVVVDPVMLLRREEWQVFDKWDFLKSEDYAFVYLVAYNPAIMRQALEYSNRLNLKAVFVTDPRNVLNQNPKGYWIPFESGVGPEEFIALLLNAKVIFTNSFHGIALAITLNKNFFAYYSRAKDDKNTLNSRIDTVLNRFDLMERLCSVNEPLEDNQLASTIDYSSVSEKVDKTREQCLGLLYGAINDGIGCCDG